MAALALLGACGFQPLYGQRGADGVPVEFSQIRVDPIPDRIGQQLHNRLLTALNPKGRAAKPRYVMTTRVTESSTSLAVRKSAFATRANLVVKAEFSLSEADGGKPLLSADSSITVSYNILDSEFATLMAVKDARTRAVREIGEDIRLRLGAFFASRRGDGR
ncbi:MAG: LPS assembly lipoprotein LptE [Rhodospirillales bacterium]